MEKERRLLRSWVDASQYHYYFTRTLLTVRSERSMGIASTIHEASRPKMKV